MARSTASVSIYIYRFRFNNHKSSIRSNNTSSLVPTHFNLPGLSINDLVLITGIGHLSERSDTFETHCFQRLVYFIRQRLLDRKTFHVGSSARYAFPLELLDLFSTVHSMLHANIVYLFLVVGRQTGYFSNIPCLTFYCPTCDVSCRRLDIGFNLECLPFYNRIFLLSVPTSKDMYYRDYFQRLYRQKCTRQYMSDSLQTRMSTVEISDFKKGGILRLALYIIRLHHGIFFMIKFVFPTL